MNNTVNKLILNRGSCEKFHKKLRFADPVFITPGIHIINWIISFLSNREQRVVVDGLNTEFVSINWGVPQGNILGPVLLSIMVNDTRPVYLERNLLFKYSEGLTLSAPVSAHQDHSLIEVSSIQRRAARNRMKLRPGRCCCKVQFPNHCHLWYRGLKGKAGWNCLA